MAVARRLCEDTQRPSGLPIPSALSTNGALIVVEHGGALNLVGEAAELIHAEEVLDQGGRPAAIAN